MQDAALLRNDSADYDFKSEGERQIAGFLRRYDLDFFYEHPLAVMDRGRLRLYYPDFYLPRHGIIIEYAGFNSPDHE